MGWSEPAPSFVRTFKRADGELINDAAWVTELDWFDDYDEPLELVEERWERVAVRPYVYFPPMFSWRTCEVEFGDIPHEEEPAVAWVKDGDTWLAVCADCKKRWAADYAGNG